VEPIIVIAVAGFLGGLAIALLFVGLRRGRHTGTSAADAFSGDPLGTDVINIARIRVAGIGGLGLVVMALVVAAAIPRIGQTLALGFGLGAVLAAILIIRSRRQGPLSSSGRSAGANTTLSIDAPAAPADLAHRDSSSMTGRPLPAKS
jgi:hypothetical protein